MPRRPRFCPAGMPVHVFEQPHCETYGHDQQRTDSLGDMTFQYGYSQFPAW